jgi:anti-anti-sigma factor
LKPVKLNIEHREIGPATSLVTLSGRLMLGPEGQELEQTVIDLIGQGYRRFIFDMSGVTHIDSTGIGRCIASLNKIMQAGGKLHMAAATGQVRDGFRVTRLDRVFRFFDDVPAAQAALG